MPKRITLELILAFALIGAGLFHLGSIALAQTRVQVPDVVDPPQDNAVMVVVNGKFRPARLDARSLQLDTTVSPPVLRSIVDGLIITAAIPKTRSEIFKPTVAATTFTLATDPLAGTLMVARNGLVLSPPDDYSLAGRVVTFVATRSPAAGDIFHFRYEVPGP